MRNRDLTPRDVLLPCPIELCVGEILALESGIQTAMAAGKMLNEPIPPGAQRKFDELSAKLQAAAESALALARARAS